MNNFDPVTGEPLTPEAKAARAAQNPQPQSYAQPIRNEEDLLQVQPTAAPKKAGLAAKLPLIGIIAGGIVAVAAIVLLISSLAGSPVKKLVQGAENTLKAMSASPVGSTVENVLNGGSVTLSVDLSKNDELVRMITGAQMDLDAQAELALFFKEGGAALSLDSKLNKSALADALIILTKDDLAVSSTALFSKTNYGINLKNMAKNLKGSIFDPEEGTDYALPESMFESLTGENALDMKEIESLLKEGKGIVEDLFDQFISSVKKNGKISKGSEKISIGDKEIGTSTVVIELDGKAVKGIASDMIDYLRKNKDVKNFLTKIQKMAEDGKFGSFLQIDEDFVDSFYEELDDARDTVDDLEDQMEDTTLTVTGYLKGSQLLQAEVEIKAGKEKANVRLTVGPDPKDPQEITLYMKDFDGSKTTVSYKVSTNDKSNYEGSLTIKEDSETVGKAKISWDKKEGDLKISGEFSSYSYYYGKTTTQVELRAKMTQSGKKTVIEFQKFSAGENSISLKGITLTVDGGAKFPSISKYTDILTLDEDEFGELIKDLQKSFQELAQSAMQELR